MHKAFDSLSHHWILRVLSDCNNLAGNGRKINHLLFVHDWKLFGKTKEEVESLRSVVEMVSRRIGLQLNNEKCGGDK
jgi:hypothetical protein